MRFAANQCSNSGRWGLKHRKSRRPAKPNFHFPLQLQAPCAKICCFFPFGAPHLARLRPAGRKSRGHIAILAKPLGRGFSLGFLGTQKRRIASFWIGQLQNEMDWAERREKQRKMAKELKPFCSGTIGGDRNSRLLLTAASQFGVCGYF